MLKKRAVYFDNSFCAMNVFFSATYSSLYHFQFTVPRRGRPISKSLQALIFMLSTHGPAKGPTVIVPVQLMFPLFQLTAPRRGRPQSQPGPDRSDPLSTHGPAKGPTSNETRPANRHPLSTHGPAKGPTAIYHNQTYFLSIFSSPCLFLTPVRSSLPPKIQIFCPFW